VPQTPTYEQLLELVEELSRRNAELERVVAEQADEIAELRRRPAADSSSSSQPPSGDRPWQKPAKKRSSRSRSGRQPGKQPGASSRSRRLVDDPHDTVEIEPDRCDRCEASLDRAEEVGREQRQVVDMVPAPPPEIIEYQRISRRCGCCGAITTPGWDQAGGRRAATVAAPGSPVRIGPQTLAGRRCWPARTTCR
jgi:transposase